MSVALAFYSPSVMSPFTRLAEDEQQELARQQMLSHQLLNPSAAQQRLTQQHLQGHSRQPAASPMMYSIHHSGDHFSHVDSTGTPPNLSLNSSLSSAAVVEAAESGAQSKQSPWLSASTQSLVSGPSTYASPSPSWGQTTENRSAVTTSQSSMDLYPDSSQSTHTHPAFFSSIGLSSAPPRLAASAQQHQATDQAFNFPSAQYVTGLSPTAHQRPMFNDASNSISPDRASIQAQYAPFSVPDVTIQRQSGRAMPEDSSMIGAHHGSYTLESGNMQWPSMPVAQSSAVATSSMPRHQEPFAFMTRDQGYQSAPDLNAVNPFSLAPPLRYTASRPQPASSSDGMQSGLGHWNIGHQEGSNNGHWQPWAPLSEPSSHSYPATHLSGGSQQISGSQRSSPGLPFQDDQSRWEGILNRSHQADRHFLYGASATRIYCRPSCASKRPSRDKIQFFPYPNAVTAATAAGYRSCKRCRPDRSTGDQTVIAVGECVRHMLLAAASSAKEGGEPKKRTLKDYAARAGLSTFHFHRSLAKVMSITPGEFAKASQSLALQDALGRDNAPPGLPSVTAKTFDDALTGWSNRRAKRALGNVDPTSYSLGDLGVAVVRTSVPDTAYGPVSVVYTLGAHGEHSLQNQPGTGQGTDTSSGDRVVLGILLGSNAEARLMQRFPLAIVGDLHAQQEIRGIVQDLQRTALREEQLPPETVPSIRRARLWATIRKRLSGSSGPHNDGSGEDEF